MEIISRSGLFNEYVFKTHQFDDIQTKIGNFSSFSVVYIDGMRKIAHHDGLTRYASLLFAPPFMGGFQIDPLIF